MKWIVFPKKQGVLLGRSKPKRPLRPSRAGTPPAAALFVPLAPQAPPLPRLPARPMLLPCLNAELTLDPKGRVMLPVVLRTALELHGISKLVAFANGGPKGGLAFYRIDDYEQMARQHQSGDPLDPRSRLFALAIASTAQTVSIDNAGRMLIPQELRNLLGLDRELWLFTAGTWFEVWDRGRWEQHAFPAASSLWDQLYGMGALKPPIPGSGG